MKNVFSISVAIILALTSLSRAAAETTLIFVGNTYGEHAPCPS
jgi:hypothetical protein